jgi:hypothetical protein
MTGTRNLLQLEANLQQQVLLAVKRTKRRRFSSQRLVKAKLNQKLPLKMNGIPSQRKQSQPKRPKRRKP